MGTSQASETGTGLGSPAPPDSHSHLPRAIVPVPMALTQYLQRSREFGRGHCSASRACDPSVSPQLRVCTHWGPPKLSLCPLSASVPVVTSRAWIPSPHLLSATECSSNSLGGQQEVPSCHHPPGTARGTDCSGQRGQLAWGRKFWVQGGSFGSREEDFGLGRKI